MSARIFGSGERIADYEVEDTQLAAGSTLGGPKGAIVIKASGAIEKVFSSDLGLTVLAGVALQFWDGPSGAPRPKTDGKFRIQPDCQQYAYRIDEGVTVHETLFVLNRATVGKPVDPLTAYVLVDLRNDSGETREFDSLAGALLRGTTATDVRAAFDRDAHAIVAWNASAPFAARAIVSSASADELGSNERSWENHAVALWRRPLGARGARGGRPDRVVSSPSPPARGSASSILVHARRVGGRRRRRTPRVSLRTGSARCARADATALRTRARNLRRHHPRRQRQPRGALGQGQHAADAAPSANGLVLRQRSDTLEQQRGGHLTWFVARLPEPALYSNFECASQYALQVYDADVTPMLRLGYDVTEIALRRGRDFVIFIGNTAARTVTTPLRFARALPGRYDVRYFTSGLGEWVRRDDVAGSELDRGFAVDVDSLGFCVIELQRRSAERPPTRAGPKRRA